MNLYKIDVKNKDSNYIYGREVWYIDPENWIIYYADKYDKQEKLWKIMEIFTKKTKAIASGEKIDSIAGQYALDVPRMHSSLLLFYNTKAGIQSPKHVPSYYTPQALLKYGY